MPEVLNRAALALFWTVIVVRGVQIKALRCYFPFYLHVIVLAASLAASLAGEKAWGIRDQRYLDLFIATEVAVQATRFAFLLWLASLPRGLQANRTLPILAAFLAVSLALEFTLSSESHFLLRLVRAGSFLLFLTACLAAVRSLTTPGFRLGRNMGIALASVQLMLFLHVLNTSLFLTRLWGYNAFGSLDNFAGVAAWGAVAWGVFDLDSPSRRN